LFEFLANPYTVAVLDLLGRALDSVGIVPFPWDADALRMRAQRMTGLTDFGGSTEGLDVLCSSVASDVRLSLTGRIAQRDHLLRSLVTRLRLQELRTTRPELLATPLVPPLIVVGLPRSGTTFLHRLLASHPDSRALAFWELRDPLPQRLPDRRLSEARAVIGAMKRVAPQLSAKHYFDAEEPEECALLFDCTLWTPTWWRLLPVHDYLRWFLEQDGAAPYRTYRELLGIFQADTPTRRLTLKSPDHIGYLTPLLAAIPNAMIVHTHRDPVPVIGSYCSLMNTVHDISSVDQSPTRAAEDGLKLWADLTDTGMQDRAHLPADRIIDVRYDDLLADPTGQVERIYAHFDLPYTTEFADILRAHLADRPQHKHGKHTYSLDDVGLSADRVRSRFTAYTSRFL
jgi:hypothetical protein